MTVISSTKDLESLTLTIVAEFDAEPERVWDVWEDPRKLERWWGPPMCPATFKRHEFVVGGESRYFMTTPDEEIVYGWWRIASLEPPRLIEFANGLAGDDGEPIPGVEPMSGEVRFEPTATGTRMTAVTRYTDLRQMEDMLERGMEEGMRAAIGQIDKLLAPAPSPAG